ncbi:hypothetical protein A3C32_04150 [Candidatus Daviesbacteria bacterium RIFCSPHIGHO2_02_FULL_41_14]|uniref:Uncharacterized protein n=1 Tax=Candidatus Daviesbacteria bacterium RIFCSPLOWO2_01_FULL_40_24 TaxID=1797787 RepID=A0A1F5MJB2_9BACT|nr:MAG: hypothetical protein A3C32_04150 [Candidatus Daviesbacteria bacterium RIFCSPHIGHO2_02_FULL_41_14]OGE65419.1 MAG: hypothetical protein A3B49_00845 [Candidatus Daviesbacteria bacterium RIFCSPLOWO2_01_FULL_40_24]OGH82006.1 MAG: hypothetical protein A3F93_04255 [Candidatus Magasanikbacteria bacterium RIFCSPLOWO2_12_FULL_34_7]
MVKLLFFIFSVLFLLYMVLPGPAEIKDFPSLPVSQTSTLEGDTIQVKNVAGYFSDNYRDFSTNYYKDQYQQNTLFPFPPLRLNYPPEFAFTAIKDQTQSTYLEEFVYPLRDSLFVNGLEPFTTEGKPRFRGAIEFEVGGNTYDTKVTLRYYPSNLAIRLVVWAGITTAIYLLWKTGKEVLSA